MLFCFGRQNRLIHQPWPLLWIFIHLHLCWPNCHLLPTIGPSMHGVHARVLAHACTHTHTHTHRMYASMRRLHYFHYCCWSVTSDSGTPWAVANQVPQSMEFSLSQRAGVGSHSLLQEIFLTQGWNPSLPHCVQILYHLKHFLQCLSCMIDRHRLVIHSMCSFIIRYPRQIWFYAPAFAVLFRCDAWRHRTGWISMI